MPEVIGRNIGHTVLKALTLFYSRIVLSKFSTENKELFRKTEREFKHLIKNEADLT